MIRRVLQALAVLLLVTLITFGLLRLIPGHPAIAILGPSAYRHRPVRYPVRLQPALVRPVLAVAGPSAALQPRLLVEPQPERGLTAGQPPAEDRLPGRDLDHPGADHRGAHRGGAGGAPE